MSKLQLNISWLGLNLAYTGLYHAWVKLQSYPTAACVCVVCIPLIPSQKSDGYDLLKIRLIYVKKDTWKCLSERGPCSQVKHGLWVEKRRSLVCVDKGSLFRGKI